MWKNKHVIIALLVAPVLALIAYFAVDATVSEKPHVAKPGTSYTLLVKSNCRYASGSCDLENGDFEMTLKPAGVANDRMTLTLQSKFPLRVASMGVADVPGEATEPTPFVSDDATQKNWTGSIDMRRVGEATLQVAVVAHASTYYAEVPSVFLTGDTDRSSLR